MLLLPKYRERLPLRLLLVSVIIVHFIFIFESNDADPTPSKQSLVNPILSTVSTSNMQTNLNSLTAFNNRYYKATTGASASTWIKDKVASVRH